ncbi:hypothetical protein ACWX0K_06995 [Nitrobacteraceae bacterium UC4446_H13]
MEKENKDQRVVTLMTPSELETIDDWMFKKRIRSRGDAIRRLCQMGIIANESPTMAYAMNVLAHFIPPNEVKEEAMEIMRSGLSLESDLKRLCLAVIEEKSKVGAFTHSEVNEAIAVASKLTEDYKNAVKGTHLDPNLGPKRKK